MVKGYKLLLSLELSTYIPQYEPVTLTNLLFISFDTHMKASSSTTTTTENPATYQRVLIKLQNFDKYCTL